MAREKAPEDLTGMAKTNMESMARVQKEIGSAFEDTSRYCRTVPSRKQSSPPIWSQNCPGHDPFPTRRLYIRNGWAAEWSGLPRIVKNSLLIAKN